MEKNRAGLLALASCAVMACASVAAHPGSLQEQNLLQRLRKTYPGTAFDAVARTPIPGWYRVTMGSNTAYVDQRHLRYLVFGTLFDGGAMAGLRNEADARPAPDGAVPQPLLKDLPMADAILTRGDGSGRRMVVFSDPGCPYCRQLETILDDISDVSVYTFMLPYQGRDLPHAIWCSPDRAAAWRSALAGRTLEAPAGGAGCSDPLDRNLALARRLHVQGTPTLLFGSGVRLDGVAGKAELEAALERGGKDESDHEAKR